MIYLLVRWATDSIFPDNLSINLIFGESSTSTLYQYETDLSIKKRGR